jgi:hypothetical protein
MPRDIVDGPVDSHQPLSDDVWSKVGVSAMKRDTRYLGATFLLLGLVLGGSTAEADLISPSKSTFALTAESYLGSPPGVTHTDTQSQGSTLKPLLVAVSASSSAHSSDPPTHSRLLVTGEGSATWTSASTGEVKFTNLGWNAVNAIGGADLSQNVGWVYTFVANVTGSFNINYSVTAQGTSSTNDNPLVGLNGFFLYEGAGATAPSRVTQEIDLNASGSAAGSTALAITAGNTYTVEIQNFSNLFGDIGNTKAHMNGTFDFNVVPAPEPSSLAVTIVASCLGGIVVFLKRGRRPAEKS